MKCLCSDSALAWVDKRLRQETGKLHEPLGGILVIILGDLPVFAAPSSSLLAQHGHSIYTLFQTVVMLAENI